MIEIISNAPTTYARSPAADTNVTALTMKQQAATWPSGTHAGVGATLQIVGEQLCEALDLRAGATVLDVAADSGIASLAAARRWCEVTAIDCVPALLENAQVRAAAEGLSISFLKANAEALPFEGCAFDVVLSTFGAMFAPNQDRAAAELLRVCKPNGKIGLANWTPDGFVGQMFKIIGRHRPSSPGMKPPTLWGTRGRLIEMFASSASVMTSEPRHFFFRYRSPEHFIEVFRTCYGPIQEAFAALDAAGQVDFRNELYALIVRMNKATDGTVIIPGEYLEVVIVKR